ncbi:MAG: hypothetical protein K8S13_05000 [Desulfobacula sp.]|uniref:hypothetical protein n=1 Tax=Desulfobacula sp. TaxID=2593537 RepID=UPI0025BB047F|nr:hypothetical protein [Desulfobacula sp.]MCD4719205.1 hypothetical protein [Desulfobacula sp.]
MKILDSNIVFSSESYFGQMDFSLEEKTETKSIRRSQRVPRDTQNLPQILVDRVSISQKQTVEYQSNYRTDITGRSSVKFMESGDAIEYEQKFAMEKLIGGVINKDVAINSIQRKEDIGFPEGKKAESNVPGRAGNSVQTRLTQGWEMTLRQVDIHFEEEKVEFSSLGEVTTEDGRIINFSLDISLNRSFLSRTEHETNIQRWQERINLTDPLVISLDGKAPQLSDVRFEFDLNTDGTTESISFAGPGAGFLAFDKNNDNIINNGSELFGPGTGNGFGELAAFDEDQNNWIDENDAVFSKLSVWTKDENGEDKLISLKDAGIGAISLNYADTLFNMTQFDNTLNGQLKSTGMFLFENGNVGSVHQIDLVSRKLDEIGKDGMPAGKGSGQLTELPQEDTQVPPTNGIGTLSSIMGTGEPQPEDVSNPLQDLLDRIEKLKEEMGRLYEKMNPASNQDRFGQNRFKRSGQRHYQGLNFNQSGLLFDYKGPVRTQSRYA